MILQLLKALLPFPEERAAKIEKAETDDRYWWDEYFIRVFAEADGYGWQIFRDNKFIYRDGKFISLVDGGFCDTRAKANYQAQDYVDYLNTEDV